MTYWVDEEKAAITPADKWHTLTAEQLIDVKNALYEKMAAARGNEAMLKALARGISRCEAMIQDKINSH